MSTTNTSVFEIPSFATILPGTKKSTIILSCLTAGMTPYETMVKMSRKGWKVYYSEVLRVYRNNFAPANSLIDKITAYMTENGLSPIKEIGEDGKIKFSKQANKELKSFLAELGYIVDKSNWSATLA